MQEYVNGRILIDGKLVQKNFLIRDKKIFFEYDKTNQPKDIKGLIVSPGFVDIHVHTRTPGFTDKEDIDHVTNAALKGGFTTIVAMANIDPPPIDKNSFLNIKNIISNSKINIVQSGRVSFKNKLANIKELSQYTNIFTDDGMPIENKSLMTQALQEIKKYNGIILLHEEDHSLEGYGYHSEYAKKNNIKTFGSEYEYKIIQRDLKLNKKIGCKIHFQHLSCLESIYELRKSKGNWTAELTPHHLFFSNEDIQNTNFKMNPPLNTLKHKQELISAFKEGLINIIATDHAPHTEKDKNIKWEKASNGIIGLESAFAAVNTIMGNDYLVKTLESMSINPGKLIGLDVSIKNGKKANLVIIDPNEEWIFTKNDIFSKSKNSPFIGQKLVGKVKEVIWSKI